MLTKYRHCLVSVYCERTHVFADSSEKCSKSRKIIHKSALFLGKRWHKKSQHRFRLKQINHRGDDFVKYYKQIHCDSHRRTHIHSAKIVIYGKLEQGGLNKHIHTRAGRQSGGGTNTYSCTDTRATHTHIHTCAETHKYIFFIQPNSLRFQLSCKQIFN